MTSLEQNQLYNDSLKYLEGRGVLKDEVRAFRLNCDAAEEGMSDAVLAMGWFYLNGVGVERNVELAKRWYRKSARQGEPRAMFSLGQMAYCERNWSDARAWFQRAADAKHHRSLFWLGKLYWKGRGVVENKKLARQLGQHAASKKVDEAQRTIRMLQRFAGRKASERK